MLVVSLLDDLRSAAGALDIQFQPSSNEIQGVLGALVHFAEHGKAFLEAAEKGVDDVLALIAPPPEPEPVTPAAPVTVDVPSAPAPPMTDQELQKQIADLQAQLATRQATEAQTVVTHEPGAGDPASTSPAVTSWPSPPSNG